MGVVFSSNTGRKHRNAASNGSTIFDVNVNRLSWWSQIWDESKSRIWNIKFGVCESRTVVLKSNLVVFITCVVTLTRLVLWVFSCLMGALTPAGFSECFDSSQSFFWHSDLSQKLIQPSPSVIFVLPFLVLVLTWSYPVLGLGLDFDSPQVVSSTVLWGTFADFTVLSYSCH